MKRTSVFVIIVLGSCLIIQVATAGRPRSENITNLESYKIQIQILASKVFIVECSEGEILHGEFVVTSDGDLYPGDQRKYDLWVGWGNGVDFYIFNQDNYENWIEGEEANSSFEHANVVSLSWSINVDQTGLWYIIYVNDSPTYIKTVKGSIYHSSSIDQFLILIGLFLGAFIIIAVVLFTWHMKIRNLDGD